MEAIVGLGMVLLILLCVGLGLAMFAFWIWMVVHAAQNKGLSDGEKVAWVLIIVFVHFIGALIYFLVGRPKAKEMRPMQPIAI